MRVGASYYPEVINPGEWERDLATGRKVGLSCLRCGEFAWSAFSREPERWTPEWAVRFLDLAAQYEYEVIWCTPSATPPPYLFDRWPELHAVSIEGDVMPVGTRRHYCPSHAGYRDLCAEMAGRLADTLACHQAVAGWQVDNEIAGDGFTCWCPACQTAFQQWLYEQYGSLESLNSTWQTGVWSQVYTAWTQIPLPLHRFGSHAPALKLDYRRFRSANWLAFYRRQYDALKQHGARRVTTNFYNLTWDIPFDQWQWRSSLDAMGISHYLEEDTASRFQLAVLQGAKPGEKSLWVLEQKAGQQAAQNLYPESLERLEHHLRICASFGVEYAIYWHLRQHAAGCEMEHGAVLRHDGTPMRIARAIQHAIHATSDITHQIPDPSALLTFSFEQHWANECRPQPGTRWNYREEVEQSWYGGACDVLGDIRVGNPHAITTAHTLVLAPFLQINDSTALEGLHRCLQAGGTAIVTADFGRLDTVNNVNRAAPLAALHEMISLPEIDLYHLQQDALISGNLWYNVVTGHIFWAVPTSIPAEQQHGEGTVGEITAPLALEYQVGAGRLIIALSALDRQGVAALIKYVQHLTLLHKHSAVRQNDGCQ